MKYKNSRIWGLIFGCPIDSHYDFSNCPFLNIWKSDAAKRIYFINSLSEIEINELIDFHEKRCCYEECDFKISEGLKGKINSLLHAIVQSSFEKQRKVG